MLLAAADSVEVNGQWVAEGDSLPYAPLRVLLLLSGGLCGRGLCGVVAMRREQQVVRFLNAAQRVGLVANSRRVAGHELRPPRQLMLRQNVRGWGRRRVDNRSACCRTSVEDL